MHQPLMRQNANEQSKRTVGQTTETDRPIKTEREDELQCRDLQYEFDKYVPLGFSESGRLREGSEAVDTPMAARVGKLV